MKPMLALLPLACVVQALLVPGVFAQETAALLAETKKTALPVLPKVVGTMQAAVKEKGAQGAIPVCKEKAPQLLQEIRQQTGWDIRRVSLKTRNPAIGTPDPWEVRQLADFNIRQAGGGRADQLEVSETVTETDGKRYFRYMKALPVVEVCVACHGPADSLSPELNAALAKDYPRDRATGYAVGQVRGALTVRRPL